MDTAQVAVTAGGAALVGLTLWFFLGPRRATAAREVAGLQEVEVVMRGGYTPDRIEVRQGHPVRLTFVRRESNPCTERVVIGDFGVSRALPEGERVAVEFTPQKSGEFVFHCAMNMVRGTIVVKPGGP